MSPKPEPAFSWDQIDALCQKHGIDGDDCPPEAITANQFAVHKGISRDAGRVQLEGLVKAGVMRTGRSRRMTPDGRNSLHRVYWPA